MVRPDYQLPARMRLKEQAIPFPDLRGKKVLDVGTDFGYFVGKAAAEGASYVLGLDRNREVKGHGFVDLIHRNRTAYRSFRNVEFEHIELGKQWKQFPFFDVVFMFSMYHHVYQCAGGHHEPIWLWLREHCYDDGVVLWENPVDIRDSVVARNVDAEFQAGYNRDAILDAASRYFDVEYHGPALHEPHREVWVCKPKLVVQIPAYGDVCDGAGGASRAFEFRAGRRATEIEKILGVRPYPGSLNVRIARDFDWDHGYYRAQVLDLVDRSAGLDSEWAPRWARFYPLDSIDAAGTPLFLFRFEGERYPKNFMELISPRRIRDLLGGNTIRIQRLWG